MLYNIIFQMIENEKEGKMTCSASAYLTGADPWVKPWFLGRGAVLELPLLSMVIDTWRKSSPYSLGNELETFIL